MSLFTQITNFLGFGDSGDQTYVSPYVEDQSYTDQWGGDEEGVVSWSPDTNFTATDPQILKDFYKEFPEHDTTSFFGFDVPKSKVKSLKGDMLGQQTSPLGQQRRRTTGKTSPDRFSGRPSRISDPRGESSAQRQLRLVGNTKGALARIDSEALLLNKIVEKLADSKAGEPAGKTITLASSKSLRGQIAPKSRIT